VYGFETKLVVCHVVLHVVGACEDVRVAQLLSVACGTGEPIFHVKITREKDVLISPFFCDVGISGLLLLLHSRSVACWDIRYDGGLVVVGDHLVHSNVRYGSSGITAPMTTSAMASTTCVTAASGRILGTQ
jgi:hypothetical protein